MLQAIITSLNTHSTPKVSLCFAHTFTFCTTGGDATLKLWTLADITVSSSVSHRQYVSLNDLTMT